MEIFENLETTNEKLLAQICEAKKFVDLEKHVAKKRKLKSFAWFYFVYNTVTNFNFVNLKKYNISNHIAHLKTHCNLINLCLADFFATKKLYFCNSICFLVVTVSMLKTTMVFLDFSNKDKFAKSIFTKTSISSTITFVFLFMCTFSKTATINVCDKLH